MTLIPCPKTSDRLSQLDITHANQYKYISVSGYPPEGIAGASSGQFWSLFDLKVASYGQASCYHGSILMFEN